MNSADEPTNDIIPTYDVKTRQKQRKKNELIMKVRLMDAEPYIDENTTLYHGDCLVEMNKIQDDSVDLVLCDLPARRNASGTP
jgi:hypothetical protein